MRIANSAMTAVAMIAMLSACGSGGSADNNASANAATGTAAPASTGNASASASAAPAAAGSWTYAPTGCAAVMMAGADTGLRIEQTREVLTIGFRGPAATNSGSEVAISAWSGANQSEATTETGHVVTHDGVQWLEFSVPNSEPGGWHDMIANATSVSAAYGTPRQVVTVSLSDSNGVARRLRSCAGL